MISGRQSSLVLHYEALGFLAIIALFRLDELIGLQRVLFGGPAHRPDCYRKVKGESG